MKITKIDVITIGLPFENPGPESSFAIADKNFLKSLLIKIETDKGLIGWGEAFGYTSIETTKAALKTMIIPHFCLLYTSPSPRDGLLSRMPSSA